MVHLADNLRQVGLFGQKTPLCPFCGYPMLPLKAFRCEYEIAKHYRANSFEADWHIDLDEEEKQNEIWSQRLTETVNKFFEERPKLCAQIRADRLNSWVSTHAVKRRKAFSQVSLISYLIKSAQEDVGGYHGGAS